MAKLTDIEGIGEVYAQKLRAAGIRTTQALLKKGVSQESPSLCVPGLYGQIC